MSTQKIHDGLVERVKQDLFSRGYEDIETNKHYRNGQVQGEIDVIAKKDDYVLIFELKYDGKDSLRRTAEKQLLRAKRYAFAEERIFTFFTYLNNSEPVHVWIRNKYNY